MDIHVYARVSPKGGRDHDAAELDSIETQLAICRQYAADHGHRIISEHQDIGRKGSDENRPGVWQAIESCGRGQGLLVWRRDRLARSVFLAETFRRYLDRAGAVLVTVTDGKQADSPEDRLVQGILDHVAEYERKVIAARTAAIMVQRQREGRMQSRHAPWGMRSDGQRLEINPEEVHQLHQALALRDSGLPWRAVAKQLNRQGERFRGKPIQHSSLSRAVARWLAGRTGVPVPAGRHQAEVAQSQPAS